MLKNNNIVKPFVKWAGGKGQILPEITEKYPIDLGIKLNRYCEPFVGGGAVLFDLLSKYQFDEVLINDINVELINTYSQIKKHVNELINELAELQNKYIPMDTENRKIFYYNKRNRFNHLKINGDETVNTEKAALFIFLNKTCFNGLFRVNSQGIFNVPMGSYKNPLICDKENLKNINKILENVDIRHGDFKNCETFINKKTFVYIDPPYRPITRTSSFTAYAESNFDDNEQIELGNFINRIHKKRAKILISNSDPKNTDKNDNFFDTLYAVYNIDRIFAKRMINCNADKRGDITELLITNY